MLPRRIVLAQLLDLCRPLGRRGAGRAGCSHKLMRWLRVGAGLYRRRSRGAPSSAPFCCCALVPLPPSAAWQRRRPHRAISGHPASPRPAWLCASALWGQWGAWPPRLSAALVWLRGAGPVAACSGSLGWDRFWEARAASLPAGPTRGVWRSERTGECSQPPNWCRCRCGAWARSVVGARLERGRRANGLEPEAGGAVDFEPEPGGAVDPADRRSRLSWPVWPGPRGRWLKGSDQSGGSAEVSLRAQAGVATADGCALARPATSSRPSV